MKKELRKMDHSHLTAHPKRRDEGLIVREVEGEVIVYDLDRHEAHCLNPEAVRLWNACDGNNNGQEILHLLYGDQPEQVHEAAFLVGLQQLQEKHLFDAKGESLAFDNEIRVSRRDLLARYGKVAAMAVALPAVISILSPTPAEAASCFASGATCTTSSQCCSGLCAAGTCA